MAIQDGRRTAHPIVLYDYQPDRRAKRPMEFLKDFEGYLHTDGYEVYHGLPEHIVTVGCLAHTRQKIDEELKALPDKDREGTPALHGKQYCDRLLELEHEFDGLSHEKRYEKRQALSKLLIDKFFAWLDSQKVLPKMPIGVAVNYALK